jgi:hypothetical protein
MCQTADVCGPGAACVANLCQRDGGSNVLARSRRFVLDATDVAFIAKGSSLAAGELPATVTLGRAGSGPSAVLLRFELPADVEVLEAFLLVDRADDATDGEGVGVHAERIVGPWSGKTATWVDGPELKDVRAPSHVLRRGAPLLARIDVRPLLARPRGGEPPDQGIALVTDRTAGAGASFVVVPGLSSPLPGVTEVESRAPAHAPRLELYVK